jgi:phenylacetate-coenzyme A ligase PaaK-like adenylate-forming protein
MFSISTYKPLTEPIEHASRDEIGALQLKRLQWSLRHAYENVPAYRARFEAAGVHPDDCRTLADLAKFPFTTKADLRDNYPFGMFAVPRGKVSRIHASSGTTGRPTVVGYTANDIRTWADVVARSLRASGVRPGMTVHVAYGYGLFTGGLGAHYGAEKLGCTVIPISGGMTERQVQLITDFRPDVIMVTPSYMLAILDEFRKQGLDPRKSSLRIGIFGAEPWTNEMRVQIEAGLGIDALAANGTWADGKAFFAADRKYGEQDIVNYGTDALTADTYKAAKAKMESFVLHGGEPGEVVVTHLVVGPTMREAAWNIVKNEWVTAGTGKGGAVKNPNAGSVELRVARRLVGARANYWFLVGQQGGMKPVYVQKRKLPLLTRMDRDTDNNVFMSNQ